MLRKRGFTLVELLVVIAIISILAAIVVPGVIKYTRRARMTRAQAEIHSITLALTKMLTDADRKDFGQFFDVPSVAWLRNPSTLDLYNMTTGQFKAVQDVYSNVFYALLRQGREADISQYGLELLPEVRSRLGTSYLDLQKDPFQKRYQFWAGPWNRDKTIPMPFRSWREGETVNDVYQPYHYNDTNKGKSDVDLPGNPQADGLTGFPASRDEVMYIWSEGEDLQSGHFLGPTPSDPEHEGGGDDINSWDNNQGWVHFYQ